MRVVGATYLKCIYAQSQSSMESVDGVEPLIGRNDLSKYAVLRLDLDEAPNIVQQACYKLSVNAVRL